MLKRTQDRKTANLATPNGKASKIANAFSLPAGKEFSCPDATAFCERICYAGKLERIYKGFKNVVLHNWELLKDAEFDQMVKLLDAMILEFKAECDKWNAPKYFRIHADGDFFNSSYAYAWAKVIWDHPDVKFWVYTRSVNAVAILHQCSLPNLSLYFSGDHCNIKNAMLVSDWGVKIAYVDETFDMAHHAFNGVECPSQKGAMPMISDKGGACIACGICPDNRKNVLFSSSKK